MLLDSWAPASAGMTVRGLAGSQTVAVSQKLRAKRKVQIRIQLHQSYVQKGQFELQIFLHIVCGVLAEGVVVPQHRLAMNIASPN
jgi:hypothetical protein